MLIRYKDKHKLIRNISKRELERKCILEWDIKLKHIEERELEREKFLGDRELDKETCLGKTES